MKKLLKGFIIIFLLSVSIVLSAQMESFPCNSSNPQLKSLFKGGVIKSLNIHGCYGPGLGNLSSTFLMPTGKAPKIIESETEGEPPNDDAYVNWTCTYSPGKISDNDPKTAWVEGVKGTGIGEVLIVPCLDLAKPVKIWAGYGKSQTVFTSNSRPKKIRTVIIRAELGGGAQYGTDYENLKVISEGVVILGDKNGYQNLSIPKFKVDTFFSQISNSYVKYEYLLGIEILEVYPGTKYEDTCISEIVNE
ncbi:MAG TPA: hypothetical protein VMV47_14245 [Bacteroidales bacterium]|nr:hypothetical protein [Bacteroidales bacterium]